MIDSLAQILFLSKPMLKVRFNWLNFSGLEKSHRNWQVTWFYFGFYYFKGASTEGQEAS